MNPNAPGHQPNVAAKKEVINATAERIFSDPDPEAAQLINTKIKGLNDVDKVVHKIQKKNQGKKRANWHRLPNYPHFSSTPSPSESNTSLGTAINLRQGLRVLDLAAGTPTFWKFRYLFIPISFIPPEQGSAHVALCAISPEAKLVDYCCSGGDSGLPDSIRADGSNCLPEIFAWLAEYIGEGGGFVASEWKLRTGAGRLQNLWRGDCGIYTVTHVMALAFGYGYGMKVGAFPKDHQHHIIKRRKRYVQDLMYGGFSLYEEDGLNLQYYPLFDAKPEALEEEDFKPLPQSVLEKLPKWARPINPCYAKCPNKPALKIHCRRNAKLYPGYDKPEVSGKCITLEKFIKWVEEMDEKRSEKIKEIKNEACGVEWVDPRTSSLEVTPRHALWVK